MAVITAFEPTPVKAFLNQRLPRLQPAKRHAIVLAMADNTAMLHRVDWATTRVQRAMKFVHGQAAPTLSKVPT